MPRSPREECYAENEEPECEHPLEAEDAQLKRELFSIDISLISEFRIVNYVV